MPAWTTKASQVLAQAVRATGNHAITRPAFAAAYSVVADIGARALEGLPYAQGVYLSGSLLSPKNVAPGVSDIDLFVTARFETTEAELEFRAALERRLRWLNAAAPIFYNLDYFDVDDVPYFLAFGNTWDQGIVDQYRLLRGSVLPGYVFERPPRELELERLVHLFGKWRKSGGALLDPRTGTPHWVLARGADRLYAIALQHGIDGNVSARGPESVPRYLAATLELMEQFADACTQDWDGAWPVKTSGSITEPSPEIWHEARTLRADGFASVCIVPDGPTGRGHRVIAVGGEQEPARVVIDRATRSFRHLAETRRWDVNGERPLILTRRLWKAAALVEPIPFTGALVASGGHRVLGEPLPPPNAPPPELLRALLRARTTELFYKARGRLLRVGKPSARARLADDLELAPALAAALDTGEIDLSIARGSLAPAEGPEAVVIDALRRFIAERKDVLRAELGHRRKRG